MHKIQIRLGECFCRKKKDEEEALNVKCVGENSPQNGKAPLQMFPPIFSLLHFVLPLVHSLKGFSFALNFSANNKVAMFFAGEKHTVKCIYNQWLSD